MVKVKKDLTGKIFGRLTVIKQVEDYICSNSKHRSQWLCQCNCGSLPVVIQGQCLTRKNKPTQSCGCVCKEKIKEKCSKENFIDDSGEYAVGYTLKGDQFLFDKEDISYAITFIVALKCILSATSFSYYLKKSFI